MGTATMGATATPAYNPKPKYKERELIGTWGE